MADGDDTPQVILIHPHVDAHIADQIGKAQVDAGVVISDDGQGGILDIVVCEARAVGLDRVDVHICAHLQKGHVEGGGHLGYAAAGDQDAATVGGRAVAPPLFAGAHRAVEGKVFAGGDGRAVDGLGCQAQVVQLVAAGTGKRGMRAVGS